MKIQSMNNWTSKIQFLRTKMKKNKNKSWKIFKDNSKNKNVDFIINYIFLLKHNIII